MLEGPGLLPGQLGYSNVPRSCKILTINRAGETYRRSKKPVGGQRQMGIRELVFPPRGGFCRVKHWSRRTCSITHNSHASPSYITVDATSVQACQCLKKRPLLPTCLPHDHRIFKREGK